VPPDKFGKNFTRVKIFIGGKSPDDFIECELSKKHLVKDVIKHVLTLYRKNKIKIFECPADKPDCFDLRHLDDDSDLSDSDDCD
jgi:hypothetical protein